MLRAMMQRLGGANQSIGRLLIICMVIGFGALIVVGIAAAVTGRRNVEHTLAVNHTYELELAIERMKVLAERAETGGRGVLLTQQARFIDTYRRSIRDQGRQLERIAQLSRDNPRQRAHVAELRRLAVALKTERDFTNTLIAKGQIQAARDYFARGVSANLITSIRLLSTQMVAEEERLLAIRDREQRDTVSLFSAILAVAALLVLLVAGLSLATVLRYTRDLGASRDALIELAGSLEQQVKVRTADLSRANEEIQRFAYIVSHDLRAPLVNVMGFTAELEAASAAIRELIDRAEEAAPDIVTEEARLAAREDLPEALAFIRTSTEKMDRLINAILKLAREGRRVIAPEPIDMVAMVETIRTTLQHRLDEQGAELSIEALPDLISDRLAIEQIFSNLIENAVKYLQPGRPGRIVVRGTRAAGRLTYEVADNGRGIAPADHQRVFDLFRRSGNQDQPGEGIGLAHVRALAYRLGGIIDVSSTLGEGATFSLSLPIAFTDLQEH